MDATRARQTERWRVLDRQVQDLHGERRVRAQAVLDVAEETRVAARARGTDPLDDLLEIYHRVSSPGAREMVAAAMSYLRAETHLLADGRHRFPATVVRSTAR